MQQNLNKEWWDALHVECPESVERFCKWIDEYKERNGWNDLFNHQPHVQGYEAYAPKFHDIPIAMQIGIIMEYFGDSFPEIDTFLDSRLWDMDNEEASQKEKMMEIIRWHFTNNTIPQPS